MIRSLSYQKRATSGPPLTFATGTTDLGAFCKDVQRLQGLDLEGTDEFVNEYNDNPDTDFHTMVAEMANIPRKQARPLIWA